MILYHLIAAPVAALYLFFAWREDRWLEPVDWIVGAAIGLLWAPIAGFVALAALALPVLGLLHVHDRIRRL